MCKKFLALNGERINLKLYDDFAGVGLIRSEYLCRKYNMYVTQKAMQEIIYNYLYSLCSLDLNKPIWYRFTDLTTNEINVLYGCDETIYDDKHFMGLKGVRRHLYKKDSFLNEVRIVSEISKKYRNIGVIIPFISNVEELIEVKKILKQENYTGKIGIMLEIPSVYINLEEYLDVGIDLVEIGLNDLTTFTLARYREFAKFDRSDESVYKIVKDAQSLCGLHNVKSMVAGYLNNDDIKNYSQLGCDIVLNYALLSEFSEKYKNLKERNTLQEIKKYTKLKIKEFGGRKMKLGIPTLFEKNSIEENLELCKKCGYDFLELNMDLPYNLPENINLENLKNYSDIEITVHLSEKLEIGELDENLRINAINNAKSQMSFFIKNLNVKKFNMHIDRGVYFNIDGKKYFVFEKFKNLYDRAINRSMQELSEFAVENNIEIYFENVSVSPSVIFSFEKVKNYKNLYYTLDVGHDERNNRTMSGLFLQDERMIHHMHLHDTDGNKDHFALGQGIIDKKKFLDMAKRLNIYVVIEVKSEQAVLDSKKYLKTIGY